MTRRHSSETVAAVGAEAKAEKVAKAAKATRRSQRAQLVARDVWSSLFLTFGCFFRLLAPFSRRQREPLTCSRRKRKLERANNYLSIIVPFCVEPEVVGFVGRREEIVAP